MFDESRLYMTDDPEWLAVWRASTLANWRHERRGPKFVKYGKRVIYRGSDLNSFLIKHLVDPAAAA